MLVQIEEIKKLKARYFRFMDTKRWQEWGDLFTEDAILQFGPNAEDTWNGRDQIVANNSKALGDSTTIHHGHMPEIEITSETTATGIWAMHDYVLFPNQTLRGYGHYEEEYVRENDQWKIKHLRLTRLRVELTPRE